MSAKKLAKILHIISRTKNKITYGNSNTLLNSELINESEHTQSSSDSIGKNIETGGKRKNV